MTVLLVSHNIRQVSRLCSRTILLDSGKIIADGDPGKICNEFYQRSNDRVMKYAKGAKNPTSNVRATGELELLRINLLDRHGRSTDSIPTGGQLDIEIEFKLNTAVEQPEIVVGTHTTDFLYLTTASTSIFNDRPSFGKGVHKIRCTIPHYPLVTGTYCVRFIMRDRHGRGIFNGETLKVFTVLPADNDSINEGTKFRLILAPGIWHIDNRVFEEKVAEAS